MYHGGLARENSNGGTSRPELEADMWAESHSQVVVPTIPNRNFVSDHCRAGLSSQPD